METSRQEKVRYLYKWLQSTRGYLAELLRSAGASPEEVERVMKLESTIVRQIRQLDENMPPVQVERRAASARARSHAPKGA